MESTAYPGVLSVAPFMLISVAATITALFVGAGKRASGCTLDSVGSHPVR